ncbi:AMP-dependent synthetase/ligase [Aliterella atlantica]|nr:AMP-binding protein [Aliterella atlantica]
MQTTTHEAFINEWRNYLSDLGIIISWDLDSEIKLETSMQVELTQKVVAQKSEYDSTLFTVWQHLTRDYGDRVALRDPHSQPIVELTYAQVFEQALNFAGGLQSLGVAPGDRVAIIAENSPHWLIADLGTLFASLVNVPRSAIAPLQELEYILRHSGSTVAILQDLKTWKQLQYILSELGIFRVILLSDEVQKGCFGFNDLLTLGRGQSTMRGLQRSQLATIMYTSGTTGNPKGVMLTHGNLMHQIENLDVAVQPNSGERVLSILPTWHCYERACEYFLLSRGCMIVYSDRRHLKQDLQAERPHYFIAVPRIWELFYDAIGQQIQNKSRTARSLVKVFLRLSELYITQRRITTHQSSERVENEFKNKKISKWQHRILSILHRLGDALVYRKIRQAIAPQLKCAITGGATLPAYLDNFYEILGIEILNGYGLTETAPVLAARRINRNVRGTVGPALPGTELKIVHPETGLPLPSGETGLVMARGPQVTIGYYENPEATAQVLCADGWFNTGDLGWLTPDGDLAIAGRAKDTIVLSNGENVEPEPLENCYKQSVYINQIVLIGQDRKRLTALILPNLDEIAAWATTQKLSSVPETELLHYPQVRQLMKAQLKQYSNPRSLHAVSDFRFVPEPFSPDNGLTTQTLKIRRAKVEQHYAYLIDEMYD